MITSLEVGLLYAVMALGVYLTYRVLDFPDLTVDGSFVTGGSVTAILLVNEVSPIIATLASLIAGLLAGLVTGLLHTVGGINPLLSGILTATGLYSINLRIMGRPNVPLLREDTIFTPLRDSDLMGTWASVMVFLAIALVVWIGLNWFLATEMGLGMRATGDNELMARSQGIPTGRSKVYGVMLSNALVAFCGALVVQYSGYSDISLGIGLIVAGLASVIVGQAVFGSSTVPIATIAVVAGSIIYRGVIQIALSAGGLNPNDMRLFSAILVIVALVLPKWAPVARWRRLRAERSRKRRNAEATADAEAAANQPSAGVL